MHLCLQSSMPWFKPVFTIPFLWSYLLQQNWVGIVNIWKELDCLLLAQMINHIIVHLYPHTLLCEFLLTVIEGEKPSKMLNSSWNYWCRNSLKIKWELNEIYLPGSKLSPNILLAGIFKFIVGNCFLSWNT